MREVAEVKVKPSFESMVGPGSMTGPGNERLQMGAADRVHMGTDRMTIPRHLSPVNVHAHPHYRYWVTQQSP